MGVLSSVPSSSRVFTALGRPVAFGVLLMSSRIAAAGDANVTYISAAEIRALATAELATRLLPDALAARAASHEVKKYRFFTNEPMRIRGVRFDLDARSIGSGLCRRDDIYIPLEPVDPPVSHDKPLDETVEFDGLLKTDGSSPRTRINIALAEQCSSSPDQPYAQLGFGVKFEEAVRILRWFASLRAAAAAGDLATPVSCWSELSDRVPDPCKADLVALLAQAPLERTFSIDVDRKTKDATVSILFTRDEPRPYSRLVLKRMGEAPYRVRIGLTHIPPF